MASLPKCRGFTHPVILLIRSSVQPCSRSQRPFFSSSRPVTAPMSLSPAPSRQTARLLATSRAGAAQTVKTGAPRAVAAPLRPPASAISYARLLAQAKHGTVLYEAAPQKVFLASSYAAALFCVGGGIVNLYFNVYNPPAGTAEWIPYAFSAVALMLSILGMNFALMPANVVRLIKVLPSAATAGEAAKASKTAAYAPPAKVRLEVAMRRLSPLPGLPLKRIRVEPQEIVMKTRLYQLKAEPTAIEKVRMGAEWEKRRQAQREYDDNHRMTLPFRDLGWALGQVFTSLRRGLTGEGFAEIEVQGKKYKIDQSNAYIMEDGRALDRLVKIEQSTATSPGT